MLFAKNDRVIFFGDSLTNRTGVHQNSNLAKRFKLDYTGNYVDILEKRLLVHYPELNLSCYNKGKGGDTTADLLARVDQDVLSLQPNWVVLLIGQNDSAKCSEDEFRYNLEMLLQIFVNNSICVLILTTTPSPIPDRNITLRRYDLIITESAIKFAQILVNVKKPFEIVQSYNESSESSVILFSEGCHLTELGNILLADTVFDVIARSYCKC